MNNLLDSENLESVGLYDVVYCIEWTNQSSLALSESMLAYIQMERSRTTQFQLIIHPVIN